MNSQKTQHKVKENCPQKASTMIMCKFCEESFGKILELKEHIVRKHPEHSAMITNKII